MNNQKEKHILALSGGKDSAALAVYMREKYPKIPLEYIFIDSGCELPETYEYLDRIQAILNINIIRIKPKKNFDYWLKYFGGVLPSPNNRWCTRLLKLHPYNKWIKDNYLYIKIKSYVGLRFDEDRSGFVPKKDGIIEPVYPFINDKLVLEDIYNILKKNGIGLPKYYSWRKRSGCYFCFFQSVDEWKGLKKMHPYLFKKACNYEEKHSDGRVYTWIKSGYLRDIVKNRNTKSLKENKKNKPYLIDNLTNIYRVIPKISSIKLEENYGRGRKKP
jgi:hypothetical protein